MISSLPRQKSLISLGCLSQSQKASGNHIFLILKSPYSLIIFYFLYLFPYSFFSLASAFSLLFLIFVLFAHSFNSPTNHLRCLSGQACSLLSFTFTLILFSSCFRAFVAIAFFSIQHYKLFRISHPSKLMYF